MRKKIRQALAELSQECTALSQQEMNGVVGGDRYTFDSSGMLVGYEESEDNWVFAGDNSMQIGAPLEGIKPGQTGNVTFSGDYVSPSLFEFLSQNTNVEWAYAFSTEKSGGMMATQNDSHNASIEFEKGKYDSIVHNHGQSFNGLTAEEQLIVNGLPSNKDVSTFGSQKDIQGYIYNEFTNEWKAFDQNTQTQEDWMKANNYTFNKSTGQWVKQD